MPQLSSRTILILLARNSVSKMDRSTLKTLRRRLQQASAGWFSFAKGWLPLFLIDWIWAVPFFRRKSERTVSLLALDFIETKQVPPDVLVELMRMALDLDIVCRVGKRRDFRFSRDNIERLVREGWGSPSADLFFKEHMQAIATRSGKHWGYLKLALDRVQQQQTWAVASDLVAFRYPLSYI